MKLFIILIYFMLALWRPFLKQTLEFNKEAIDRIIFLNTSPKESRESLSSEDITFLKENNIFINRGDKRYALNVKATKSIEELKEIIRSLKDKGFKVGYYRANRLYYILIGYFNSFEEALSFEEKLPEFKNSYPMLLEQ